MPQVATPLLDRRRGERVRQPTDRCPKALLALRGKCRMARNPEILARASVCNVVNNTVWFKDKFPAALEVAGAIAKTPPGLRDLSRVATGEMFLPGFDLDLVHSGCFAPRRAGWARGVTSAYPGGWRH